MIYWQIKELDAVSSADQHKGRHSDHGIHSIGTLVRRWSGSARRPRCLRDRVLSFIIICAVLIKFFCHRFQPESLVDVASKQLNYSLANKVKPLGGWDAEHEIAGVWRPTGREYHMVPLSYASTLEVDIWGRPRIMVCRRRLFCLQVLFSSASHANQSRR